MRALHPIISLCAKSLRNRRATAGLTVFAIAMSVMLVLGIERVRTETRASFANTISGTDLIVGARSGQIQLLLYSVFRIGNATNNISWSSYQDIASLPKVKWTIPISLGDSHRGYRVLGTNGDYFRHYRYGRKQTLRFAEGKPFEDLFETVLGADVARELGYALGDPMVVTHGLGAEGFSKHYDLPFRVSGILRKTGTPVDRTVHVSLPAIEAIHVDWQSGARIPGKSTPADRLRSMKLEPKTITAVLMGLDSRFAIFGMQRHINEFPVEPLLAILPGVALQELWQLMGTAETALAGISVLVVIAGLLGMVTMLLSGLNERRREMAVLRAVGAGPRHVFLMYVGEALILTIAGAVFGLLALYAALLVAQPFIDSQFGLYLAIGAPTEREWIILGLVGLAGFVSGVVPAVRAMRQSVADGMIVRT